LYNQLFFNVMNKDAWNKLPPDLQKIFTDTTAEFYAANMPKLWDNINAGGYKNVREQKDVVVTVLSPEETARWVAYLPPIQDEYVSFLNERGLPGEDILQTMKGLADKYNAQYPAFAPYITD
jgi:TRAP-type C4-dicarboxylate transport system substrate-binding protein